MTPRTGTPVSEAEMKRRCASLKKHFPFIVVVAADKFRITDVGNVSWLVRELGPGATILDDWKYMGNFFDGTIFYTHLDTSTPETDSCVWCLNINTGMFRFRSFLHAVLFKMRWG